MVETRGVLIPGRCLSAGHTLFNREVSAACPHLGHTLFNRGGLIISMALGLRKVVFE